MTNGELSKGILKATPLPYHDRMSTQQGKIRVGMVGLGMIFDDTYRPLFEQLSRSGLYHRATGHIDVELSAVGSRTGKRAQKLLDSGSLGQFVSFVGESSVAELLQHGVDVVCIATPDNRHFSGAKAALQAGKHVLIEKPSVLSLQELDELVSLADQNNVLARVVYHKLADPDHKRLRTLVVDNVLQHVNSGFCSLLEPKQISGDQFAEWITGRNPGTYVAVHYLKLIDFSFGPDWRLTRIQATGQRGLVGPVDGPTWDSVQLQVVYTHPDQREAAFDIHTSWVTPDNFPGYVEQEVQFRFDNAIWNAHQRQRGVELAIEGQSPTPFKNTPNHHYNGSFLEPWGERSVRGYGLEIIQRFLEEVAYVKHGGPDTEYAQRLSEVRSMSYADLSADRNVVAIVQSMEALLAEHEKGNPGCVVRVNQCKGGLALYRPGQSMPEILYSEKV